MEQTDPKTVKRENTDMEGQVAIADFIASGRTGRRNAMPNILNSNHASVGTGGLAEDMEKLNCAGGGSQNSSNTQTNQGTKSGQGS